MNQQLIAESTGKQGKGILPVVGEALGEPSVYGDDRVFVTIGLENFGFNVFPSRKKSTSMQHICRIL